MVQNGAAIAGPGLTQQGEGTAWQRRALHRNGVARPRFAPPSNGAVMLRMARLCIATAVHSPAARGAATARQSPVTRREA